MVEMGGLAGAGIAEAHALSDDPRTTTMVVVMMTTRELAKEPRHDEHVNRYTRENKPQAYTKAKLFAYGTFAGHSNMKLGHPNH